MTPAMQKIKEALRANIELYHCDGDYAAGTDDRVYALTKEALRLLDTIESSIIKDTNSVKKSVTKDTIAPKIEPKLNALGFKIPETIDDLKAYPKIKQSDEPIGEDSRVRYDGEIEPKIEAGEGIPKNGFGYDEIKEPHAFLQWKGTDACFDFHCECGAHCHFDGFFAYVVKCPHCQTVWEMPHNLFPRKASESTMEYWRTNPQELEPDEDMPLPPPPKEKA